jgi:hypothetical protein
MARRPKPAVLPIEETIRLSSEVTVLVRAAPAVYDTLTIQRVGGVVTVALQGAGTPAWPLAAGHPGEYVPPTEGPNVAAARAALAAQFPAGPATAAPLRDVVSPASLGLTPLTPEMLGEGAGSFAGRSNEDGDGG